MPASHRRGLPVLLEPAGITEYSSGVTEVQQVFCHLTFQMEVLTRVIWVSLVSYAFSAVDLLNTQSTKLPSALLYCIG